MISVWSGGAPSVPNGSERGSSSKRVSAAALPSNFGMIEPKVPSCHNDRNGSGGLPGLFRSGS